MADWKFLSLAAQGTAISNQLYGGGTAKSKTSFYGHLPIAVLLFCF
ncbi:hypothetical protein [Streptococcus chenjunshii]|nr:hypothetical protein [Streptococcus chenjunshii]